MCDTSGQCIRHHIFLVYINDLQGVVHSMVKLFADDAKISAIVNNENDADVVQRDLHNLDDWSDKYDLRFNYQTCRGLHTVDDVLKPPLPSQVTCF